MEKRTYYVSPQNREVLTTRDLEAYEFEVEATTDEVAELQELLLQMDNKDFETFWDGHFWLVQETMEDNKQYDHALQELYHMIYRLGTQKTKEQMLSLGLVQ